VSEPKEWGEVDGSAVDEDLELDDRLEPLEDPVEAMTREEVRKRAEAPLPRSLLDFLR
jgi:hypothetical protein